MALKPSERGSARASLANLDRDGSGEPGGSLPRRFPMIHLETGAVLVLRIEARDQCLSEATARLATAADLEIAGRSDLADLL